MNTEMYVFPPSTDCEIARWLLELYGVPYKAFSHTVPFFVFIIAYQGGGSYPYVRHGKDKISALADIFQYFEAQAPEDKKLLSEDNSEYADAKLIWEDWVLQGIDIASAPWAYSYLLPHKDLTLEPITKDVPGWEKGFASLAYPLISWIIRYNQSIDDQTPEKMGKIIRDTFDKVDEKLADGRKFLAGDRLSVADIGFAAAAAPVVLEPLYGHGGLLPTLEEAPAEMQGFVKEMRDRPAGKFVSKIYQEFR